MLNNKLSSDYYVYSFSNNLPIYLVSLSHISSISCSFFTCQLRIILLLSLRTIFLSTGLILFVTHCTEFKGFYLRFSSKGFLAHRCSFLGILAGCFLFFSIVALLLSLQKEGIHIALHIIWFQLTKYLFFKDYKVLFATFKEKHSKVTHRLSLTSNLGWRNSLIQNQQSWFSLSQ